ncbi:cell division protein FtsL [Haloimpatiens massiliensis]|uniref:cell division protein FtsL n=1 Tax=Haloimpatiens massiliensis TaxID=1658110 RepID=UPI000C858741
MILMNKNNIDGSTALVPKREEINYEEERKKQQKKELELLNKTKEKSLKNKFKIILGIGMVFSIGMILVLRFAYICNLRQQVIDTQNQITNIGKENENLKVELLKYDNIKYIEKIATEKLNMERPNLGNAVYCDLGTKYFKENTKADSINKGKKLSFIEFIKSKLF